VSKNINFIEVSAENKKIILDVLGYRIKDGIVCDKNGTPITDKYGNKITLEHVAIVPNPDGEGHILIKGDVLTISEYLGDLANMEYSLMKKNKEAI